MDLNNLLDQTVDGLTKGSIYALVALGYTLVYGVLKLINFAHSEVFMVGIWAVLGVYTALGITGASGFGALAIALVLGIVAAVVASAGTALAIERIAYRPLRKKNAPPLIYLITSIGCSLVLVETFGFVLRQFFGPPFGRALVSLPSVIEFETWLTIGDVRISNIQVIVIVSALAMMIALDTFVNRSRLGRGVRAVAQDPDTAALMGVNKDRIIMLVFVIGGAMAGVAALLHTLRFGIAKFDIGFLIGVKAFTAAVLGGIGNLRGALVGGLLLGVVETFSSSLISSNWEDVTAFVVLILVLMFRPTGILGESLGEGARMIDALRNLDSRRMAFADGVRKKWDELPPLAKAPVLLALVAFLFYLPFLNILPFAQIRTDLSARGSDWSSVLFIVVVFSIIAVGLNVVIGLCGLLDLGYVGFFAIGAYSMALFGSPTSPVTQYIQNRFDLADTWAVAWAALIPIAMALTMVSGVILGAPTLRLRGDYLALVTMGFGEIIRIVARNSEWTGGPKGVSNIPKPPGPMDSEGREFFNVLDLYRWYWLALVFLIILIFAVRRLEHSRVGRAWMAIREDEDAAAIMGVPTFSFKLWAFAIGAALGGVSGALFASRQAFIDPGTFDLQLSFLFVAMVVIGGSGNLAGAVVGAVLLTYLPERFREIEEWRNVAFGIALVTVMILRPQGLVPNRRRARELEDRRLEAQEEAVDA